MKPQTTKNLFQRCELSANFLNTLFSEKAGVYISGFLLYIRALFFK